jgi:hypothetical protein
MRYLKIKERTYTQMMAVIGQRPFNEVHTICRGLQGLLLKADDGELLIKPEAIQPAADFMHTKCLHCEVHEILKDILAAPFVEVAEEPTPRGRKASVNSKT